MSYYPYADAAEWAEGNLDTLLACLDGENRAQFLRLRDEHYNGPNANGQNQAASTPKSEAVPHHNGPNANGQLQWWADHQKGCKPEPTSSKYSDRCLFYLIGESERPRSAPPIAGNVRGDAWRRRAMHGWRPMGPGSKGRIFYCYNRPPPTGSSVEDIAAALRRAGISKHWEDTKGNTVDLSKPTEVIQYVEDNIDSFSEELRAEFLRARDQHYRDPKNEDERRMKLLQEFYEVVDKPRVHTCEEDIAMRKGLFREKFSWDIVWSDCEKKYGMNPSDTSSSVNLQMESQRDATIAYELLIRRIMATMARSAQTDPIHPAHSRALKAIERLPEGILSDRNEQETTPATSAIWQSSEREPSNAKKSTKSKSQRKNARRRQKQKQEQGDATAALRNISDISNQTSADTGKTEKASDSNVTKGKGASSPAQPKLTLSMLASETPEVQKNMIGERLYHLIHKTHPEIARKIMDRLLELDNSSLLDLLESPKALEAKISEVDRYSSGYWRHFVRSLKPVEKRRSYVSVVVP